MSTEAATTTPEGEVSPKAPRVKNLVNVRLVASLDQAERYATVAQRPEVVTALAKRQLAARFTTDLLADIGRCRGFLATFVQSTTDRQVQTEAEKTQRTHLVLLLQGVQSGAKRLWARKAGERDKLKGYYVGTTLKTLSFAELSVAAETILRQAKLDTLPGVTPADLTALETTLQSWKAVNEAQAQAQNGATTAHAAADLLAKGILNQRIELQLVADQAFPYNDSAHTAIRKEFGLPKNGPFSTV